MLTERKILLCVSGGIAAYKSVELASLLVKSGAVVKTIMTANALEFITPLTFQSITKQSVSFKQFNSDAPIEHISLSDWADLIVIAPATANIIGKIANGIADDLLSTTIIASTCPKLIVPVMNVNMWENPIVQQNIIKLKSLGYNILEPDTGRLACGIVGKGKMPAPIEILYALKTASLYQKDLQGKKILITVGATVEMVDTVRFISNLSTGKMGIALARAAYLRGADVTIVHANISVDLPYYTQNIRVFSANEMYDVVLNVLEKFDIVIATAAVSDFTPAEVSTKKIKKSDFEPSEKKLSKQFKLKLKQTEDILLKVGQLRSPYQFVIGFAAESEDLIKNATDKLKSKKAQMIVANHLSVAGSDNTNITILPSNKSASGEKFYIAHQILDEMKNLATSAIDMRFSIDNAVSSENQSLL
jgi:phosphopantothenoylcysteine decarboxylase/phosphopantothenate--cysteine ligase